jgi:hypothetical protein
MLQGFEKIDLWLVPGYIKDLTHKVPNNFNSGCLNGRLTPSHFNIKTSSGRIKMAYCTFILPFEF